QPAPFPPELYTLSLHDALPILFDAPARVGDFAPGHRNSFECLFIKIENCAIGTIADSMRLHLDPAAQRLFEHWPHLFGLLREVTDRKSTRLNSSHLGISYAVFC